MAGYGIDLPPGVGINPSHVALLREVANRATGTAAASQDRQPSVASEIVVATAQASTREGTAVADQELATFSEGSGPGILHYPDEKDGVFFWPFRYLPGEVRTMIWTAAAEAAKPQGVYRFKLRFINLGLNQYTHQLSKSLFKHISRLDRDSPLVRSVHEMMYSVYEEQSVLTLNPLPAVGQITREVRDLLRSCSEARSELTRGRVCGPAFSFHWLNGDKCDLGVIRPFSYETDWVSLGDLIDYRLIRPGTPGVRCTPDLARVQNLAIPYLEFTGLTGVSREDLLKILLRTLDVFRSLRSLGMYEPSFSVGSVVHWKRVIKDYQRLFLKGVSTSVSDAAAGERMTRRSYQRALLQLKKMMKEVTELGIVKRSQGHSRPAGPEYGRLNFCLLLHAESEQGLGLMGFKEDGSHFDDVARIEELGALGRQLSALRTNA